MNCKTIGVIAWFQSDETLQTLSRKQIGTVEKHEFWMHGSCPLLVFCVSKDRKAVQFFSRFVSRQCSNLWSDLTGIMDQKLALKFWWPWHRTNKHTYISGAEFCSRDRIHFKRQSRHMVYKNALFECTFEYWDWEGIWNAISDAKTRSRECTLSIFNL